MKASRVEEFLQTLRREGGTPDTIKSYHWHLQPLLKFLDGKKPEKATRSDLDAFVDHLYDRKTRWDTGSKYHKSKKGGLSRATLNSYIGATKRFYSWLVEKNIREDDPAAHLVKPARPEKEPKAILPEDFVAMLKATARSRMPERDRAILCLFYSTGIRLAELAGIQLYTLKLERGRVVVRGKGNKARSVYFDPQVTGMVLRDWLAVRPSGSSQAVFTTAAGTPLTKRGIVSLVCRLAKRTGIQIRFRPHSMRHRFALTHLDVGDDVASLARMMGHKSPRTTLKSYARWSDADIERKMRANDPVVLLGDAGLPVQVG
jgi:site-specific recombinase XerD